MDAFWFELFIVADSIVLSVQPFRRISCKRITAVHNDSVSFLGLLDKCVSSDCNGLSHNKTDGTKYVIPDLTDTTSMK